DWLVNLPKEKVLKKSNNAEIVFEEQDFDGFLNKLKEYPDIEYLGEVLEHSWGQRVIRFYDLDGPIIEVGEDMKMVIKRFLASGMNMEEIAVKMDASVEDLMKLLNH
ncbi:glyoxalase, partial [[Clostridium] symbiosum]